MQLEFRTQKGMTLPELMIALSLMCGIGLVTAKLMGDQTAQQNQIKMSAEVNTFVSSLQNFLAESSECKKMFKDKVLIPGNDFFLGTPGSLDDPLLAYGPASKSILAERDYGTFSLADQSVKLKESSYGGNQPITSDGSLKIGTGVYDLTITFTPKIKKSLLTTNPSITKSIPIVLSFKTTGGSDPRTITGCGPIIQDSNVTAKKTLCDALGGYGVWNTATSECKLQEVKCPFGQAMIKMTSLGSKICAPIANQVDLATIFNTSSVPCSGTGTLSVSINQNAGKFTLNCSKSGGSTSCTSVCDCPGQYDTCSKGKCVSRETSPCVVGEIVRGTNCQYVCQSSPNGWGCAAGGLSCTASGTTTGGTTTGGTTTGGTTTTSGGSGGGCFIAGTQIMMANGDKKNIEDIQLGDKLLDSDGNEVTVMKLLPKDYYGDIYSINGGPYFFTPNHPFLSLDGWKSLSPDETKKESPDLAVTKLKVGDVLLKKDGIEIIMSLDSRPTAEKVYNFMLDGSHTYFADDYKVHNKLMAPTDPPVI